MHRAKSTLIALLIVAGFVLAVSAAPSAAPTQATPALSKELASLQGTWTITAINDQALSEQGIDMALVIDGGRYSQIVNGAVVETGNVKLDGSKSPWTMDLEIKEGNDAGQLQLGIVEVKGDALRMFLAAPGATKRPADFSSPDGAMLVQAARKK